ncbi:MAG: hypothetical protein ACYTAF_17365, partial [Planctomycetota bacterium]
MRQSAIVFVLLLVLASGAVSAQERQREIALVPGAPEVEHRTNVWKVTFPLSADLPDRAYVSVRISCYTLSYNA